MKIRKRIIVLAFLAVAFISAMAQKQQFDYTIYGVVEDSITHEGEPYATLSIYRKGHEEKAVQMAVTDANGKFKVAAKGEGDYVLEVKSVSRTPLRRFFTVSKQSWSQNLGTLLVSDSKTELKGVEVVAYKPLVKADIDKLTYSVEDDPESQTNTVMEMLKKVPMVSVDGQDNVKVNGSTSFKVYVNGKPNNMMTKNPKEVLKSMPATGIKKIEVITNPGPKYDAEGVAGILNIVTAGSGMEGYTATFSGNGGTRGGGGGLFATVKKGKFTMSVNYNSNFDNQGKATKVDMQSILDDEGNYLRTTTQDAHGKTKNQWHGGTLEASYEIDTLRLVSASFSMNRASWNTPGMGSFTSVAPYLDNKFLFSHDISGKNKGTYNDISAGIDYQRSFKTPGRLLTFSYRLESNPCTTLSDYRYTNLRTTADWADYTALLEDVRSDGDQSTTEHTFQLDFTTPFAKYHTIETGAKYILRQNKAFDDRYSALSESGKEQEYDTENSSHYKHRNDILAAYLGYGLSVDKWSARLGLRYEHTFQKVKYLLGRGSDFSKDFDDLVPSAKIGYKISDTQNLSFNYKMRISRPGIWYLNPYLSDTNREQLTQGNPNLESEKNHSFDLQFGSFAQKLSYNISVGYNFTDNSIQSFQKMVTDNEVAGLQNPTGKQVLYTTYYNMGKTQSATFNGYASWSPFTCTRLVVSTWGGYSHFSDGQGLKNHGWSMSVYAQLQQTIAKTWTASASVFKMTPGINLQGKTMGYFSHTLSLRKSMLNDRLNITFTADNPFQKYYHIKSNSSGKNFATSSSIKFIPQSFSIGVSYRIGKLQSGVKKTERTITNDDVKSGGGGSGKTGGDNVEN